MNPPRVRIHHHEIQSNCKRRRGTGNRPKKYLVGETPGSQTRVRSGSRPPLMRSIQAKGGTYQTGGGRCSTSASHPEANDDPPFDPAIERYFRGCERTPKIHHLISRISREGFSDFFYCPCSSSSSSSKSW